LAEIHHLNVTEYNKAVQDMEPILKEFRKAKAERAATRVVAVGKQIQEKMDENTKTNTSIQKFQNGFLQALKLSLIEILALNADEDTALNQMLQGSKEAPQTVLEKELARYLSTQIKPPLLFDRALMKFEKQIDKFRKDVEFDKLYQQYKAETGFEHKSLIMKDPAFAKIEPILQQKLSNDAFRFQEAVDAFYTLKKKYSEPKPFLDEIGHMLEQEQAKETFMHTAELRKAVQAKKETLDPNVRNKAYVDASKYLKTTSKAIIDAIQTRSPTLFAAFERLTPMPPETPET
jgi:hypothetical protein